MIPPEPPPCPGPRRPIGSGRRLLGITGPPGAGKSTYAAALVASSTVPAVVVPMDGFHLASVTLTEQGTLDRRGSPETFDVAGYAALLERLRREPGPVYVPDFQRDLETPVAAAITVAPEVELVVTEGNYLLLPDEGWARARSSLDEVWYLDLPDDVRRARLVARHVRFGKTPDAARAWVERVDDAHAALVARHRHRADRVITLDP